MSPTSRQRTWRRKHCATSIRWSLRHSLDHWKYHVLYKNPGIREKVPSGFFTKYRKRKTLRKFICRAFFAFLPLVWMFILGFHIRYHIRRHFSSLLSTSVHFMWLIKNKKGRQTIRSKKGNSLDLPALSYQNCIQPYFNNILKSREGTLLIFTRRSQF